MARKPSHKPSKQSTEKPSHKPGDRFTNEDGKTVTIHVHGIARIDN